jgi:threonine dehydrogenase-like Zn-dependent dehydrogenase
MAFSKGAGFDLVIETGGTSSAIETGHDIVAAGGTLVSLGIVNDLVAVDVLAIMRKEITWLGVVASVRRHWAEAIRLIQRGTIRPEQLITHRMSLDDAVSAIDLVRHGPAVKVMFSPAGP